MIGIKVMGGSKPQSTASSSVYSQKHQQSKSRLSPKPLSFYQTYPFQKTRVPRLRIVRLAYSRYKIFQTMQSLLDRGKTIEDLSLERKNALIDKLVEFEMDTTSTTLSPHDLKTAWTNDQMSHHFLKQFLCQDSDLARQLITWETKLMQFRWLVIYKSHTLKQEANEVIQTCVSEGIDIIPVKSHIVEDLGIYLKPYVPAESLKIKDFSVSNISWYLVPCEAVMDLVRSRRVHLWAGKAFVTEYQITSVVVNYFQTLIKSSIADAASSIQQWLIDPKYSSVYSKIDIPSLYAQETVEMSGTSGDEVIFPNPTSRDIGKLVHSGAFPLCMMNIQTNLVANHHIFHQARLQYRLFIKGIGMELAEALEFFKTHFNDSDFERKYAYNIRHAYGLEGGRKVYDSMSCRKIIHAPTPSSNQAHGCPFKTWTGDKLKRTLARMNISAVAVENIVQDAADGHFGRACKALFDSRHPGSENDFDLFNGETVVNHPNAYYKNSQRYHYKKLHQEEEEEETTQTRKTPTMSKP